jgi:hypothetical protein
MIPNYKLLRSRRRTLGLEVTRDGCLVVRAPRLLGTPEVEHFIVSKQNWIDRHVAAALARRHSHPAKRFIDNEEFLYLGRAYKLTLVDESATPLVFEEGFLLLRPFRSCGRPVFSAWYKERAVEFLGARAKALAGQMAVTFGRMRLTDGSRRWGSCTAANDLRFNWRLIMAPQDVIDYVVIHELMHIRHKNHSPAFWLAVAEYCPQYSCHRAWLRSNGHRLTIQ